MNLNTLERLVLSRIVPKEGDITTLRIIRDLRAALSFSEEEHAALQFSNLPDGRLQWKRDCEVMKEVTIGAKARSIIRDVLIKLNEEKKLSEDFISLYEKFVEETA
jgi:hypothetical protein